MQIVSKSFLLIWNGSILTYIINIHSRQQKGFFNVVISFSQKLIVKRRQIFQTFSDVHEIDYLNVSLHLGDTKNVSAFPINQFLISIRSFQNGYLCIYLLPIYTLQLTGSTSNKNSRYSKILSQVKQPLKHVNHGSIKGENDLQQIVLVIPIFGR